MSLLDFIEKLRQKPRYVRVQITWAVTIVCMAVIFVLWVWSLGNDIAKTSAQNQQSGILDNLKEAKEDLPSLWQSLTAGIGNVVDSVKEGVNDLKSEQSTSTESAASESPAPAQNTGEALPIQE